METHRPVDSGYSWVVLVASTIMTYFVAGTFSTLSILQVEFLDIYPEEKLLLGWTTAIHVAIGYTTSVPICWCIVNYGRRILGLTAAILLSSGFIVGAVVREPLCMLIAIGCVGGISAGFIYNISILSAQKYFSKKWMTSQGIIFSSSSLGFLTYPLLVRFLTDQYSWYGAMLLHAGMLLHIIPCCLLLKEPRPKHKMDLGFCTDKTNQKTPSPLDTPKDKTKTSSIDNIFGPVKDHPAILLCLFTVAITQAGSVVPLYLSPLMAEHIRASKFQGALLLSIAAAVSLVCRSLFGYAGDKKLLDQKAVCGCAGLAGGVITISIYFINNYMVLAGLIASIAVPASIFMSTWPATVVEMVHDKHIPLSLGYGTMCLGFGDLSTVGLTAFILHNTGNPRPAFIIFGLTEAVGGLLYFAMYICKRIRAKHNSNATQEVAEACIAVPRDIKA